MFLSDAIRPVERMEKSGMSKVCLSIGTKILRWACIAEQDSLMEDSLLGESDYGNPLCR